MMVMNILGQCGPLIGASSYPKSDAPHYVNGMLISGAFMLGVVILAAVLRWKLKQMNLAREKSVDYELRSVRGNKKNSLDESVESVEEAQGLIEDHHADTTPKHMFRYML